MTVSLVIALGSVVALPITARTEEPESDGAVAMAIDESFESPSHIASRSCVSCHAFPEGASHPVNIPGPVGTPTDLPLESGKITCLTCHDDRASRNHSRLGRQGDPMLRRDPDAEGLCIACHSGDSSTRSPHATGVRFAHHGSSSATTDHNGYGGIDAETQSCMSCHDGLTATDAGGHNMMRMGFDSAMEHPIGVELVTRNSGQQDEIRFVPKGSLDPRVVLYDGRVGCGSCHSVFSKHTRLLVMPNLRSKLCLSCHVE